MDYDCRRSPGYAQDRCLSRDGRGGGGEYGRRGHNDCHGLLGCLEGGFQLRGTNMPSSGEFSLRRIMPQGSRVEMRRSRAVYQRFKS